MLKDKIVNSKPVHAIYKALFYFELGKGTTARFYQFIPDMIIILGGLKFLLNVNLTPKFVVIFVASVIIFFSTLGYCLNKFGLYQVDKVVQASKDPVQHEIYTAAQIINNREKLRQERLKNE